ncbi:hypothetical protein WP1_178 [Pseudomonas phage WP1]
MFSRKHSAGISMSRLRPMASRTRPITPAKS